MIHCCCLVERLAVNVDSIKPIRDYPLQENENVFDVIKLSFRNIELSYNIKLPPIEIQYIYELIYD